MVDAQKLRLLCGQITPFFPHNKITNRSRKKLQEPKEGTNESIPCMLHAVSAQKSPLTKPSSLVNVRTKKTKNAENDDAASIASSHTPPPHGYGGERWSA
jgi:uncharacterized coiled-coil protein SlyX